jgi:hypothetical protein
VQTQLLRMENTAQEERLELELVLEQLQHKARAAHCQEQQACAQGTGAHRCGDSFR